MTTKLILNAGHSLINLLSHNEHTEKAADLNEKCTEIQTALQNKTSYIFQVKLNEVIQLFNTIKQKCIETILSLNGSYYQDPRSILKKQWDSLVEQTNALGISLQSRSQLDAVRSQLEANGNTDVVEAIDTFYEHEKTRDRTEKKLERVIGIEKASIVDIETNLKAEKASLNSRHLKLCGHYFQDPNGLLDQAWVKLQEAKHNGSSDVSSFTDNFNQLEDERKEIEGSLFEIDRALAVNPSDSYEKRAEDSLTAKLERLTKEKNVEESLSGIAWGKVAMVTVGVGLAALHADSAISRLYSESN